jgi:hypothetical protein
MNNQASHNIIKPVKVSSLVNAEHVDEKCRGLFQKQAKKTADLNALGEPNYNNFLKFVKCQSKSKAAAGNGNKQPPCKPEEKSYDTCHQSVMGVGSYNGRKACAQELSKLVACAMKTY